MRVSSLKIKFGIIAALIGIVCFGITFFLSNRFTSGQFEKDHEEKMMLIWKHIIHDLEEGMIRGTHGEILTTLESYRTYRNVGELRIFNLKGREAFNEKKGSDEPRVMEVLQTGNPIHFRKVIGHQELTTTIIPIQNKPECHHCHGKSEPLRGALLLSLSLEGLKQNRAQQNLKYLLLFAFMTVAISTFTFYAVNRLLLKPLGLIQKGTEAIGRGELEYRIPVEPFESKDEIGSLITHFNQMAQTLRDKNEKLWEQFRLLSRSYKEWQETFDSITDLVAVIDRDCHIIRANRAFHQYFSISPYEEINRKCSELFGICLDSQCPHQTVSPEKTPLFSEFHDHHSGKILEISFFPCFSSDGHLTSSVLIAKDITEKKENEMRLIMNERFAALGQMAAGIAHEINNPLATISACTEGLIKRIEKAQFTAPLFESYLKIIEEEVARCKAITSSMLSFVKKSTDEKKKLDIHEALDKTLELINLQGRLKEVEIKRNYHEEVPLILGNEGELRQVFLSIIGNALDSMENRGRLELETIMNGDYASIKITDSGPGIPSHLIDRIFEPFFTTKSEKGGTGLGLSIAIQIIKENNGTIEVTSQEKEGTTFTISLPV